MADFEIKVGGDSKGAEQALAKVMVSLGDLKDVGENAVEMLTGRLGSLRSTLDNIRSAFKTLFGLVSKHPFAAVGAAAVAMGAVIVGAFRKAEAEAKAVSGEYTLNLGGFGGVYDYVFVEDPPEEPVGCGSTGPPRNTADCTFADGLVLDCTLNTGTGGQHLVCENDRFVIPLVAGSLCRWVSPSGVTYVRCHPAAPPSIPVYISGARLTVEVLAGVPADYLLEVTAKLGHYGDRV